VTSIDQDARGARRQRVLDESHPRKPERDVPKPAVIIERDPRVAGPVGSTAMTLTRPHSRLGDSVRSSSTTLSDSQLNFGQFLHAGEVVRFLR
jgi:hypothetical protein